jgi:hypothetical protein
MADFTKTAFEFLQELRQERDELDALIEALEKRLSGSVSQSLSGTDAENASSKSLPTEGRSLGRARTRDAAFIPPVTSMPMGFFHNLSQAAAAEKLLKMNPGQTYTTGQMLDAFRNSGMPLNPKNSVQILYTALKRNPKFERIGNKAWGLREWYPEKKKRTNSDRMLPDPDNLPDHNPIEDIDQDEVQRLVKRN